MDIFWVVISGILILMGIIGSFAPVIPGPPLSYAGLWTLQLSHPSTFTMKFLIIWGIIVVVVTILDYVIPIYGTKKFGGSSYGVWGCIIGLFMGMWIGPIGIIAGPFIGAFVGELIANNNSGLALKAAIGSFVGFIFSTLLKLIACLMMGYYFLAAI